WLWVAKIGTDCLSARGVTCRVCEDTCPTGALRFRPAPGGRALAARDIDACTGCGGCVAACPQASITLHQISPKPAEATC
ncbi:MAG: ferredoxin-type protein NapF, partial [Alphaproteobacteria bacterium HGW-Alphaproteobacteria-4]